MLPFRNHWYRADRIAFLTSVSSPVFGDVQHFLGFEAGFLGRFITLGFIKRRWKQTRDVLGLLIPIHHGSSDNA
jgi:hypothetical protein